MTEAVDARGSAGSTVVAAACPVRIDIEDPEGNRERVAEAVRVAAGQGADLVVVPELACSGYVFSDRTEAERCAESVDGRTLTEWADLSARHRVVLVGGFCERGTDGFLYNSAAVLDRGEPRAVYRKAHLWDREKEIFHAGSERPPVVSTSAGRVGVVICYDLNFPEWMRFAARDGARIVAAPTNWPAEDHPAGERPLEVVRVQSAASANRVFVVAADRRGSERGVDWVSGSVIVGPSGFPLAGPVGPAGESPLVAELDLGSAADKANGPRNNVVTDRRPDLYLD